MVIWIVRVRGVFGIAFHVGASAPETDRRVRLGAQGTMTPAMLAMAALLPCQFGSLSLVIVASQAALVLAPVQTAALIAAQTVVLRRLAGVRGGHPGQRSRRSSRSSPDRASRPSR